MFNKMGGLLLGKLLTLTCFSCLILLLTEHWLNLEYHEMNIVPCEETFVKEEKSVTPKFTKVPLNFRINKLHHLYFLRNIANNTTGVPILVLPSTQQSFAQLAKWVAIQQSLLLHNFKLDIFMSLVQDGEEVESPTHLEADQFLKQVIPSILSRYDNQRRRPKSVIIFAEKMAGHLAKSMFTYEDFNPKWVNMMVIWKLPKWPNYFHSPEHNRILSETSTYWNAHRSRKLKDVILVYLRDDNFPNFLVDGDFTIGLRDVPLLYNLTNDCTSLEIFKLFDHIVRDLIDKGTGQLTVKKSLQENVLDYYLKSRRVMLRYPSQFIDHKNQMYDGIFSPSNFWSFSLGRQFRFKRKFIGQDTSVLVRLLDDNLPPYEKILIAASNLPNNHTGWIYGCLESTIHQNSRICSKYGEDLISNTLWLPEYSQKRYAEFNADISKVYSHLVVIAPKKAEDININIDLYMRKEREFNFQPNFWNIYYSAIIVNETSENALVYKIFLPDLTSSLLAYHLEIIPVTKCVGKRYRDPGLIHFSVPWLKANATTFISQKKIMVSVMWERLTDNTENPYVKIFLNPSCRYKIQGSYSVSGMIFKFADSQIPTLASLICALAIISYSKKLSVWNNFSHQDIILKDEVLLMTILLVFLTLSPQKLFKSINHDYLFGSDLEIYSVVVGLFAAKSVILLLNIIEHYELSVIMYFLRNMYAKFPTLHKVGRHRITAIITSSLCIILTLICSSDSYLFIGFIVLQVQSAQTWLANNNISTSKIQCSSHPNVLLFRCLTLINSIMNSQSQFATKTAAVFFLIIALNFGQMSNIKTQGNTSLFITIIISSSTVLFGRRSTYRIAWFLMTPPLCYGLDLLFRKKDSLLGEKYYYNVWFMVT